MSSNFKDAEKKRRQQQQAVRDAAIAQSMQRDLAERNSPAAIAARQREALLVENRARERLNYLNTEVTRLQNALNGLAQRVRALRTRDNNTSANCGDVDVEGNVIAGGSGEGAVPFNPGFNNSNRFGVTIAEVNGRLHGFSFDQSDSAAAKYRSTDVPPILVHL